MEKVELLYHKQTNTYWSNDKNWKKKWQTETISYGTVTADEDSVFNVKRVMNENGYVQVKDVKGTPFEVLNKIQDEIDG